MRILGKLDCRTCQHRVAPNNFGLRHVPVRGNDYVELNYPLNSRVTRSGGVGRIWGRVGTQIKIEFPV